MATAKDSSDSDSDELWLEEAEGAQVFIIFSPDDTYRIGKYILQYLEQRNIKYVIPDHIVHSGEEAESIVHAVNRCNKTLLILSRNSNNNIPISLQMMLALEKSVKINRMSLMVLMMDGILDEEIPRIPVLLHASRLRLVDNIHERCMAELVEKLQAEVDMTAALPAGNFSAGMVWSHFLGYLTKILPRLASAITECKWFNPEDQDDRGRMPVCFFMLLPASGRAPKHLNDEDPNVKQVGYVEISLDGRPLRPNVYEVTDPADGSTYYCCAEYPSAFCALGSICDLNICDMTPQQRYLEVERFNYKMEEILNHENNRSCRGLAKLLLFNDENKNSEMSLPSYHLSRAAREELNKGPPVVERLLQTQNSQLKDLKDFRFDVCLMYDKEDREDKRLAEKLRRFLEDKKIKCVKARPEGDKQTEIEERVNQSKWVVLFISKNSLKSTRWVHIWLAELISLSEMQNQIRVLPLLIDVEPSDIPDFIRWVTYIDVKREPKFEQRVLQAVEGESITMESQIPVGNVAFGLAWSFEVNYLHHFLPGLEEKIQEKLKTLGVDFETTVYSTVMFEIIPRSCMCEQSLQQGDKDEKIFELTPLNREKTVHGTKRVYQTMLYRMNGDDGKQYYFAGEYASPVKTLRSMHNSMLAGLNNEQLAVQVKEFVRLSEAIQNCQDAPTEVRSKCQFVYFDDSKRSLSSVLFEKMQGKIDKSVKRYWNARNNRPQNDKDEE